MIGQQQTNAAAGSNNAFVDEVDCGSFFDQIDDLLDFPSDDIDAAIPGAASDFGTHSACLDSSFPSIWTAQSESLPGSDSVFSNTSASDLSAELSVPYEDIVQLEWLSNFVEDSFSGGSLTMKKEEGSSSSMNKDLPPQHHQFQTLSPVSVLESSSSCSGDKTCPEMVVSGKRGRARSKRPRPATFTPRPAMQMQLTSPASSVTETPQDSECFAESRLLIKMSNEASTEQQQKKKKIKFTVPANHVEVSQSSLNSAPVRKCMHCEITKTPQWRAGPMGPKTLCNACGVRYKSGRLFPEYRPAASPTFIPSLHSNSHKKVVEMRTKVVDTISLMPASPELIPNDSNPAIDYM